MGKWGGKILFTNERAKNMSEMFVTSRVINETLKILFFFHPNSKPTRITHEIRVASTTNYIFFQEL